MNANNNIHNSISSVQGLLEDAESDLQLKEDQIKLSRLAIDEILSTVWTLVEINKATSRDKLNQIIEANSGNSAANNPNYKPESTAKKTETKAEEKATDTVINLSEEKAEEKKVEPKKLNILGTKEDDSIPFNNGSKEEKTTSNVINLSEAKGTEEKTNEKNEEVKADENSSKPKIKLNILSNKKDDSNEDLDKAA